jgi:hypothetical protein
MYIGGLTGGSATVTLDSDLPSGNYAFMIVDKTGENYSGLFPLVGSGGGSKSPSLEQTKNAPDPTPSTTKEDNKKHGETSTTTTASSNPDSSLDSKPKPNESDPTSEGSGGSTSSDSKDTVRSPDGSGGGGLSAGAKAGLGAGVGVVGLAALILAGLLIYRRGKAAGKASMQGHPPWAGDIADLDIDEMMAPELDGQVRSEITGDPRDHARELGAEEQEPESLTEYELA